MNHLIDLHPEVKEALENNKPVIALESTIISHGMPYPQKVALCQLQLQSWMEESKLV